MNFLKKHPLSILAILTLFIISCGTETETPAEPLGKKYLPLVVGKTVAYDLDSIIYDPISTTNIKVDTNRWQIRETVVDTFKNSNGETVYRIERTEKKRGSTDNFKDGGVFSVTQTTDNTVRNERNLRFIKLPTFFSERTTWDGNLLNDPAMKIEIAGEVLEPFSKKWASEIKSVAKAEKIGAFDFNEVTTVEAKSDPKILTELRYNLEKYAKNVGLVYREYKIMDTQKLDGTIAWEKKAEKGFIIKMTVTSF